MTQASSPYRPYNWRTAQRSPKTDNLRKRLAELKGETGKKETKGPPPKVEEPPRVVEKTGSGFMNLIKKLLPWVLIGGLAAWAVHIVQGGGKEKNNADNNASTPTELTTEAHVGQSEDEYEVGALANVNTGSSSTLAVSRANSHEAESGAQHVSYDRFGRPISVKAAHSIANEDGAEAAARNGNNVVGVRVNNQGVSQTDINSNGYKINVTHIPAGMTPPHSGGNSM